MLLGLRSGSCSAAPGPAQGVPAPARPPSAELAQGGRHGPFFNASSCSPCRGEAASACGGGRGQVEGSHGTSCLWARQASLPGRQVSPVLPAASGGSWGHLGLARPLLFPGRFLPRLCCRQVSLLPSSRDRARKPPPSLPPGSWPRAGAHAYLQLVRALARPARLASHCHTCSHSCF